MEAAVDNGIKRCSKCKQLLSKGQFSKNKRSKDGLSHQCKGCHNKYYKKNVERINIQQRKRYAANPKRQKVYQKGYDKKNPERYIWCAMRQRCCNPNNPDYKYYGGRGIKVCDRWLNSFKDFLKDVGKRPSPELTIDRIDNNGNYEPGNVKWSTWKEQNNNQRNRKRKKGKRNGSTGR